MISALLKFAIRLPVYAVLKLGIILFCVFILLPVKLVSWAFDLDRPMTSDEYNGRF